MFTRRFAALTLGAALVSLAAAPGVMSKDEGASAAPAAAPAAAEGKTWYLVISPHTQEGCLAALDSVAAEGAAVLQQFDWGCMAGDHTGYARVQAAGKAEALKMVPASHRSKARAIELNKFTLDQIRAFHESH